MGDGRRQNNLSTSKARNYCKGCHYLSVNITPDGGGKCFYLLMNKISSTGVGSYNTPFQGLKKHGKCSHYRKEVK